MIDSIIGLEIASDLNWQEYWLVDKQYLSDTGRYRADCRAFSIKEARERLLKDGIRATHCIVDLITGDIIE